MCLFNELNGGRKGGIKGRKKVFSLERANGGKMFSVEFLIRNVLQK